MLQSGTSAPLVNVSRTPSSGTGAPAKPSQIRCAFRHEPPGAGGTRSRTRAFVPLTKMDIPSVSTPAAAFVAGLATSLHCAGMCGPLACAIRAKPAQYHIGRLISYTAVGALLGGVGWSVRAVLDGNFARFVPWLLAAVLVIIGFGLDKKIPQPRFVSRILFRVKLSKTLGWLTPLLPCGPLWLMFGVAILAGTWLSGAALLASFAAGTIPLYALLQTGMLKLQSRGPTPWLPRFQQALALTAAALLVWRAMLPSHDCCH